MPGIVRELLIQSADGTSKKMTLEKPTLSLGRSAGNDLAYPEDPVLSRNHLVLEREADEWYLRDLHSKNGTEVNGERVTEKYLMRPGDRIAAGRLVLIYADPFDGAPSTLEFVDDADGDTPTTTSVMTSLDQVIAEEGVISEALGDTAQGGAQRMQALIHAGRELAGHRPLADLFRLILDLSTGAVGATRGVLMTLEGSNLIVRAAQGEGFRISAAVRDRVIKERASLLVKDARQDAMLRGSMSIVEQRVRSLMAVPLQTENQVIGLIYVDSPDVIRQFTSEDLNLLTVMANVAAIRIEHARLVEVEQAERLMSKDLEQAAEIQRNLLPRDAPGNTGLDLAGHSVSCRAVGGDYFDYLVYPDGRVAVIVGDVAGKGLPASLMMSSFQARVQVLAEDIEDLAILTSRLNNSVAGTYPPNRFVSFFITVINPTTGELSYCNAGHNPPLVVRASGEVELLEGGGPVLGIIRGMNYQAKTSRLDPGDFVFLYSDGVTEARDPADEEYGEERLTALLQQNRGASARSLLDEVRGALTDFMAGTAAADDITMVIARRFE